MPRSISRPIVTLLLGLAVASCSSPSPTDPGGAAAPRFTVQWIGGVDLQGVVGEEIADPIGVQVLTEAGLPAAGLPIAFATELGSGEVVQADRVTGMDGRAFIRVWRLGIRPGTQSVILAVTAPELIGFGGRTTNATVRPGAPAAITAVTTRDGRYSGFVGKRVAPPPELIVVDRYENPVPGVPVRISISAGVVAGLAVRATDGRGRVRIEDWQSPTYPSAIRLAASVTGLPPVEFTAEIEPNSPVAITDVQGDQQVGPAGSILPAHPSFRTVDEFGNGSDGDCYAQWHAGSRVPGGSVVWGPWRETFAADAMGHYDLGPWQLLPGENLIEGVIASLSAWDYGVCLPSGFSFTARGNTNP